MDIDRRRTERRYWWLALVVLAAVLAVTVFKVPLGSLLLLGVFLLCPLLMYGMHGGHGHGESGRGAQDGSATRSGSGSGREVGR